MTDQEWKLKISNIDSPIELLSELVSLSRENCPAGDSYYEDLWYAIVNRAAQIVSAYSAESNKEGT